MIFYFNTFRTSIFFLTCKLNANFVSALRTIDSTDSETPFCHAIEFAIRERWMEKLVAEDACQYKFPNTYSARLRICTWKKMK